MTVSPYVFFDGRADEAIEFYKKALGAKVNMLLRYKESPDPNTAQHMPPGTGENIMHAELLIGESLVMVSDGRCGGNATFDGFSLSMDLATAAEAERIFAALSEGGNVQMPMAETFFSPRFGMVADKFGVVWLVMARK